MVNSMRDWSQGQPNIQQEANGQQVKTIEWALEADKKTNNKET